jgi:integral membrane sensor domain MASE1
MRARGIPYLLQVFGVALAYGAGARLGQLLAAPPGNVSALWPSSGIAVAALALFGNRVWPGVWLGSFAYNFLFYLGSPILETPDAMGLAVGFATAATLMAVAGAAIPQVIQGRRAEVRGPLDVLAWTAGAGMVAPLISATLGTFVLALMGMLPATPGPAWRTWWLGDATGIVLVAPAAILWARHGALHFRRGQETEALLAACALSVTCLLVFAGGPSRHGAPLLLGLPLLFLSYTALRFGRRVTATTALVVAVVAAWSTAEGRGPLLAPSIPDPVAALQIFLLTGTTIALVLAAAQAEARRLAAAPPDLPLETGAFPLQVLLPAREPAPPPPPAPPAGVSPDLAQLLDALPDPVYILTRDTLTVTRGNDAFARALGLADARAAEGRSLFDLFPPGLALLAADEARRVFHTGEPREDREHWPRQAGEEREYGIHRAPLRDQEGNVTGLVARARPLGD